MTLTSSGAVHSVCSQNTGWQEILGNVYYNIGAMYISLEKYQLSLEYLDRAEKIQGPYLALAHKRAIALIRSGRREEARLPWSKWHSCFKALRTSQKPTGSSVRRRTWSARRGIWKARPIWSCWSASSRP